MPVGAISGFVPTIDGGLVFCVVDRQPPDPALAEQAKPRLARQILQQNQQAYWETTQIARLLRRRGIPLTETQRDGVFDILVEVHERYPSTKPTELDEHSEEYIKEVLRQIDDTDRHVVELVPSVLSPTQVAHVFEAYDYMSRERINDVETAKKWRIQHPGADVGWVTSARWNPR